MVEPLKNHFGPEIPRKIAAMIKPVHGQFPIDAFLRDALDGYEPLDLTARGRHIARALHRHLPAKYPDAIKLLIASLGPKLETTEAFGMAPFLYLPHVQYVAEYGLDHFEPSMNAQYELTQRFSAEFSVRRFLERHPDATLARLRQWTKDPSPHVRRLVSEGTRPRVPWAPRLRAFQRDPRPVIALLELLKDDPVLYVRRSVANNLNDIGKDHPTLLADIARRWLDGASAERRWLVRHALRSAVKRGEAGALAALGFGTDVEVTIDDVSISPKTATIGGRVSIAFWLNNRSNRSQDVVADLRIHFVKASGKTSPKTFKLKTAALAPGANEAFRKVISLAEMTTRKHYPGTHVVEVLLNGRAERLGEFALVGGA